MCNIRIASMRRFYQEHTTYLHVKENRRNISIMFSDLAQTVTLISPNYPCLEHIFMVPNAFEPLKSTVHIYMFLGFFIGWKCTGSQSSLWLRKSSDTL